MCALVQHPRPSAQSTKSLSDTNNLPTLPSAASLDARSAECMLQETCMLQLATEDAAPLSLKSVTDLLAKVMDQRP